jgi:hypothetical protein
VSAKRVSIISRAMMVVALAAVNLAVIRAVPDLIHAAPSELVIYPHLWVLLGCIDFLIIWKLILTRSLRAFHYTFLIVFVIAFFVIAFFVATERIHPLGYLVRWYQYLAGENTTSISLGFLRIGELWMACFLSFTLACAIGLAATWLERRRGWDIAAFFRGALIGLGIFILLAVIHDAAWPGPPPSAVRMIVRLIVLGVCLTLGGLMGLSRLKSKRPAREDQTA